MGFFLVNGLSDMKHYPSIETLMSHYSNNTTTLPHTMRINRYKLKDIVHEKVRGVGIACLRDPLQTASLCTPTFLVQTWFCKQIKG